MISICVKKPKKITLDYGDGVTIEMDVPAAFDQMFFTVDADQLQELDDFGVLCGEPGAT